MTVKLVLLFLIEKKFYFIKFKYLLVSFCISDSCSNFFSFRSSILILNYSFNEKLEVFTIILNGAAFMNPDNVSGCKI